MIRQAISCDICATEKKQTNHWFVAYEHGGELRVGGWTSRNRLRPGSKHLCGQTCLHKLVDEFMAKAISMKVQRAVGEESVETPAPADTKPTDTSLTSKAAYAGIESLSSPRVETPATPNPVSRPQAELVTMPGRPQPEPAIPLDEPPAFSSRSWRAEAWERERERELNAAERRPDILARRRSRA